MLFLLPVFFPETIDNEFQERDHREIFQDFSTSFIPENSQFIQTTNRKSKREISISAIFEYYFNVIYPKRKIIPNHYFSLVFRTRNLQ